MLTMQVVKVTNAKPWKNCVQLCYTGTPKDLVVQDMFFNVRKKNAISALRNKEQNPNETVLGIWILHGTLVYCQQ